MSYTKITDYAAKDGLVTGNPSKIVRGTELGAEFDAIATADALNVKTTALGTGVQTFLATPTSANLLAAVTDETGTGALVFANSPTLVTPALGTPSALVGTNITGTAAGLTAGNATLAATVTVVDAASDTTTWPMLATSQTGNMAPATDAGLTYNSSTNALTTTTFVGALTGAASSNALLAGSSSQAFAASSLTATALTVTGATNLITWSKGGDGYGAHYVQGSGTNASYYFMGNVDSGELARITSANAGSLIFGVGNAATTVLSLAAGAVTIVGTIGATSTVTGTQLISSVATGTAPLTVTSITKVDNLYADKAGMPQNSQSAAYTTVLADANKHILHPTADNNARTFTIDSNANVAYAIGTCITFYNQINTVTIAITADTMTLAGVGTTGSRTLAAYGMATALKVAATNWVISGTGLS